MRSGGSRTTTTWTIPWCINAHDLTATLEHENKTNPRIPCKKKNGRTTTRMSTSWKAGEGGLIEQSSAVPASSLVLVRLGK